MSSDTMENKTDFYEKNYEETSWIIRFFSIKKHRYLERIEETFFEDKFNLYGLSEYVPNFDKVYYSIKQDLSHSNEFENESILYLLAHQRYICSKNGMDNMLDKVLNFEYGRCGRIGCVDVPYVPLGLWNEYGKDKTWLYCYNCGNAYKAHGTLGKLDGSAWGTSFAHFLILSHPYIFEKKPNESYVPRIFGFKISELDDFDSA